MLDCFHSWDNVSLFRMELTSLVILERALCLNRIGFNLANTWWFYLSKLSIPISDWMTWGLCTSGSTLFVLICMKLIALTFNNRKKIILLRFNILCKPARRSPFSFFSKLDLCWQLLLNLFIPQHEFLIFLSFLFCNFTLFSPKY